MIPMSSRACSPCTVALATSVKGNSPVNPTLVTLTIGQSPRSDILPLLLQYLPAEKIAHAGLLDGLNRQQIAHQFGAHDGDKVLVSRLSDGSQVLLASDKVENGLRKRILQLEDRGFETILLLCTGEFGRLYTNRALLLEPDRMIPPLIAAMVGEHDVGIVVPVAGQIQQQAGKWKNLPRPPCFAVASPYLSSDEALLDAGRSLQDRGADVVVLDCFGYHCQHRDMLSRQLAIPILLSGEIVARLAAELLL
uniref:Protein aroM n=1 Tax=Erwinia amylovora ATCC BAA-2158 TaxID=889211 RepID=E5B2S1_ERWAM|nr:Protein aroM [Erwinia amylovora ATCC BAA-2158]